jgi:hypothetical protein
MEYALADSDHFSSHSRLSLSLFFINLIIFPALSLRLEKKGLPAKKQRTEPATDKLLQQIWTG